MLVYDLEIIKAIPSKSNIKIVSNYSIEYCEGWNDYKNMGISCLCAYEVEIKRYRVFTESNKNEFIDLAKHHNRLIGFNNINFDNKVIRECWDYEIDSSKCYDILRKIWRAAGFDENKFTPLTHSEYGLDACCKANLKMNKTSNGALAPILWQQGKIGDVIDYCLEDVRLTYLLLKKITKYGYIFDPKTHGRLEMRETQY